jgi:protein translocase SEC61 complex gamma subunit
MSKYESLATSESSIKIRIKKFLSSTKRIIKVASKPTRKEYWLVTKICLVGMLILGGLSYVVQLIAAILSQLIA